MTKIGILGFGQVGEALAKGFIAEGHTVQVGGRTKSGSEEKVKKSGINAVGDTNQNVAAWAEVIVLTTPAAAAVETAKSVATVLEGKTVIDVGNPISGGPKDGTSKKNARTRWMWKGGGIR